MPFSTPQTPPNGKKFSLSKLRNHLFIEKRVAPDSPFSEMDQDEAKNIENGYSHVNPYPNNGNGDGELEPHPIVNRKKRSMSRGDDDLTETDSEGATVIGADYQMILDMISSSSIDPVIITTSKGTIISCNNEALSLFGYKRWNIVEKVCIKFIELLINDRKKFLFRVWEVT